MCNYGILLMQNTYNISMLLKNNVSRYNNNIK